MFVCQNKVTNLSNTKCNFCKNSYWPLMWLQPPQKPSKWIKDNLFNLKKCLIYLKFPPKLLQIGQLVSKYILEALIASHNGDIAQRLQQVIGKISFPDNPGEFALWNILRNCQSRSSTLCGTITIHSPHNINTTTSWLAQLVESQTAAAMWEIQGSSLRLDQHSGSHFLHL